MGSASILHLQPDYLLRDGHAVSGLSVVVVDDCIEAIGTRAELDARFPLARTLALPGQMVMPGFINAHQHGRGLTSIQLGGEDDILELWLARKRLRATMDPYPMTLYAALRMLASGVTSAIQANTTYGTGDYERELRDCTRAYTTAGMRVMIGVGAMDRAMLVYPADAQDALIASLPPALQKLAAPPPFEIYAGGAAATLALLARLRQDYDGEPLISFGYAPAGPQWVSDELLEAIAQDAAAHDLPVHMHGLESLAQAAALREVYPTGLLRQLGRLGLANERLSLAHAVWLSAEDAEIAASCGATLVRNPASNLRLRAGLAPLAHYLQHGARMAIGTDNTTLNDDEDLLGELRLAARLGRSPYWDGPPPPSSATLLDMIGINAAHAMRQSGRIGVIRPGAQADLIAVSLDTIQAPYLDERISLVDALLARGSARDVRMTMVAGRIVYQDGRFPGIDPDEVAAQVAANARATAVAPGVDPAQVAALVGHLEAFYASRSTHLRTAPWAPITEISGWS